MSEKDKINFEQMWQEAKEQLSRTSKDILDLMKKGEEQIVKVSEKANVNFNNMVLKLKKEQLFHSLGKEFYKISKKLKIANPKLSSIIKEVKDIDKQINTNDKQIKNKK